MRNIKQSKKAVLTSLENSHDKDIPCELKPFFESMIPSQEKNLISHIYYSMIVPYVDDFIKNKHIEIETLKTLKSLFIKNNKECDIDDQELFLRCKSKVQFIDQLEWSFENEFFKAIWNDNSKLTVNSFLPNNAKELLRSIVKIQILILMRNELTYLSKVQESHEAVALNQWVERELLIRTSSFSYKNNDLRKQIYNFKPNDTFYFFNGASRVFIFCQVELKKVKDIFSSWYDWSLFITYENTSLNQITFKLVIASLKFIFDLFFTALMPYRLLRTLVNELSHAMLFKLNAFMLDQYPKLSISNHWMIFHFIFQTAIYIGLILLLGLPIFPLPLEWIPVAFFSPYLPLAALGYIVSIVFFSIGESLFTNLISEKHKTGCHVEKAPIEKIENSDLNAKQFLKHKNPLYEKFCEKNTSNMTLSNSLPSKNLNILKRLSK